MVFHASGMMSLGEVVSLNQQQQQQPEQPEQQPEQPEQQQQQPSSTNISTICHITAWLMRSHTSALLGIANKLDQNLLSIDLAL
jgi:hypothetical protein